MVYQDPHARLNPSMTIGRQLIEVPMLHLGMSKADRLKLVQAMLQDVRLPDPVSVMRRYPHQLSGGQQQRVVIAMALMARARADPPGRADDRARRHGRGRGARSRHEPAAEVRHEPALHLPQSGPGARRSATASA